MMLVLTDDELSALIEACNVTTCAYALRGKVPPMCVARPPWDRAGSSAHNKLVHEEAARAEKGDKA